jgi:eukaryotic-like serine/threonine-protein kinase
MSNCLKGDNKLFLIDFGGAKEVLGTTVIGSGTIATGMTGEGTILYTPGYAAIEQIKGRAKPVSDIYSLGATCIRLLTGCLPAYNSEDEIFDDDNEEWLWQEYLQRQGIKIEPQLAEILNTMVERLGKNRYQSAQEILDILNPTSKPQPKPQPIQPAQNIPSPPQAKPKPKPSPPISQQPVTQRLPNNPVKQNPAPTINRSKFLQLIGYGGTGTILFGLLSYLSTKNSTKTPDDLSSPPSPSLSSDTPSPSSKTTPTNSSLKTFSFPVITVNNRGEKTKRVTKSAKFQTVDIGNGVTMDFVSIPAGEFMMGSPASEEWRFYEESPQHRVKVPAFFMGKYQVTQVQYQAIMGSNPAYLKGTKRPVEQVSWNDCLEFCQKLSQKLGKNCRLPSEAEWEYACRAGTTTPFHFGATITTDLANFNGNYPYASAPKGVYRDKTTDVGSFPPNAFGLYDMHGNVWEWCQDDYIENYDNAPDDGSPIIKSNNSMKVRRGGSWDDLPVSCRSATRNRDNVGYVGVNYGFRVVLF